MEKRMQNGDFIVVDATHVRGDYISKYHSYCDKYRFENYGSFYLIVKDIVALWLILPLILLWSKCRKIILLEKSTNKVVELISLIIISSTRGHLENVPNRKI
jgi:predicted kinase